MKRISVILGALIIFSSSPLQAIPIDFDLDNLLLGSTESLSAIALDCRLGNACNRRSGINIKLSKPGTGVTFPDVAKTPSPAGPIPIPYPNFGGSIIISTGVFTTPAGELANLFVDNIVDSAEFVSFDIFVDSPSGYMLPSIVFVGKDENGLTIERELILRSVSVPEPTTYMLLVIGLAALAGMRIVKINRVRVD